MAPISYAQSTNSSHFRPPVSMDDSRGLVVNPAESQNASPVLEVTLLSLTQEDTNPKFILSILQKVRHNLAASGNRTYSRFYRSVNSPQYFYVLGIWPSLKKHREFLASDLRDQVLEPQELALTFEWTVHVDLDFHEVDRVKGMLNDARWLEIGSWEPFWAYNRRLPFILELQKIIHFDANHRGYLVAKGWKSESGPEYIRVRGLGPDDRKVPYECWVNLTCNSAQLKVGLNMELRDN